MQADLPHTLYLRDKKRGGRNTQKEFKFNPADPAITKTLDSIRRRREMMRDNGQEVPYTMDELFNKQ